MAKEIERKFLVDKKAWRQAKDNIVRSYVMTQGYLSKAPTHNVRVRVYPHKAELTIKGKMVGITRPEFNYEIPVSDGDELLKMCDTTVKKTRHFIQIGDHTWTVDEFFGVNKGLLLAEIELSAENEKFELPGWISMEVTYDRRYTNAYLTAHKVAHSPS